MQVANLKLQPVWYFVFGPKQKTSLASQFALEHNLAHLTNPHSDHLKEKVNQGLVIESAPQVLREAEAWKLQITVIFLKGQLTLQERNIKKEYQSIGRCVNVKENKYEAFRKQIYPKLIIIYSPNPIQNQQLHSTYFCFNGYKVIKSKVTANEIIKNFPKQLNYVFFSLKPQPTEFAILEPFFHLKVIHIKHNRSQMSEFGAFFDEEAKIVPAIQTKTYFNSVQGNKPLLELLSKVGEKILPEIIFANTTQKQEKDAVQNFANDNEEILHLNLFDIQEILKKRPIQYTPHNLQIIINILFRSLERKYIVLTGFPSFPNDFMQLEKIARPIKVFADCQRQDNYRPTKQLTPSLYFLETEKRKKIQLDLPFLNQINTTTKYLIVSGPPCVGKTSAAKFISTELGYRHIQYEAYIASIKEKLIAPEDGQELPFHKIIKHFSGLIAASGNSPILIDGFNIDWKDIDNWVKSNGSPTVLNLKTDEKELIRRTRRKAEADVNAEVTEEQAAKTKEAILKNSDWADQFTARCPFATVYNIDFTLPLIQSQKLLSEVLKPRVFLIQSNYALLFQNIAIRYDIGYFNLNTHSIKQVSDLVRKGHYRNVIINGYQQYDNHLVCQDFSSIEKHIGTIRYLCVWSPESRQANEELLHLEPPAQPEKPKPAEGEQGGEAPPPPAEEEGEAKKKVFNIYEHQWTKPGNQKNISQWFFKLKKQTSANQLSRENVYNNFGDVLKQLAASKELSIYHTVTL